MHCLATFDGGRGVEKSWDRGFRQIIVRRGENRPGRFLEVVVYAVGGWRRLILFPKGRDGRGWSRVCEELSKALAFLEATDGSPSSGGPLAGKKLGKEVGFSSFADVVRSIVTASVMGCQPLV